MPEREAIRLVVWDLDETFWRGTLSEGGLQGYVRDHHDIVIELAKRGIISSICSKNDHAAVEQILKQYGIWDYFILPSIDWSPKGPRLRQLVEDIQLRPETILFIDDNASNRAEAVAHVPGLQVSDEGIIPAILGNELFKGKDDSGLTRMKQYQLLQRRKTDERAHGADNKAFLRSSHIRVAVEPNIEAHLDRALELINRTNQLNFTKLRLSDDRATAGESLLGLANRYTNQAGLVRVWDDYGDYGFCGLYVVRTDFRGEKILHFCFSCRILGMGVERWLYQKLGKPPIDIIGEVLTDLDIDEGIDWINQDLGGALLFAEGYTDTPPPLAGGSGQQSLAPEIRLRGGCELDAISHYLRQETPKFSADTNYVNCAFLIRRDETTNIALSLSGMNETIAAEIEALALFRKDFDRDIFASPPKGTLFVISTWGDIYLPVYRHNTLGFEIEVAPWYADREVWNLAMATDEDLDTYFERHKFSAEMREQVRHVVRRLSADYTNIGNASRRALLRNWKTLLARIPEDCLAAIILPNSHKGPASSETKSYHAIVCEAAKEFQNVFTLDPTPYMNETENQQDDHLDHLDRMVYFNIYKSLVQQFEMRLARLSDLNMGGTAQLR